MPKLLMNCDQVFEVLTRAPFPTGAESDESVEHHLRCCHECRELAEALQPAVALLHEAIAPDEASGLPEYQGVLARLDHQIATAEAARTPLVVRRMTEPQRTVRRRLPLITYARFTAALVLLLAVGSLVWSVVSTTKHGIAHRDRAPARLDQAGLVTLASLNLPAKCFPRELLPQTGAAQPATPAAINQDALRCCTECHNGASTGRAVLGSVATLHRSCVACHSL